MILDSSALVAVLCREPGWEELFRQMAQARTLAVGAPTVAETQMVLTVKLGLDAAALVDQFLAESGASVVPFGREHISIFYGAFQRYGKGRHPARLNMGDCFSYAVAVAAGQPLLFVGDDFPQTDVLRAQ